MKKVTFKTAGSTWTDSGCCPLPCMTSLHGGWLSSIESSSMQSMTEVGMTGACKIVSFKSSCVPFLNNELDDRLKKHNLLNSSKLRFTMWSMRHQEGHSWTIFCAFPLHPGGYVHLSQWSMLKSVADLIKPLNGSKWSNITRTNFFVMCKYLFRQKIVTQ